MLEFVVQIGMKNDLPLANLPYLHQPSLARIALP